LIDLSADSTFFVDRTDATVSDANNSQNPDSKVAAIH